MPQIMFFNQYSLEACLKIMCYASSKDSTYIDGDIRFAKSLMVNEKNPKNLTVLRVPLRLLCLYSVNGGAGGALHGVGQFYLISDSAG